jgi:hypothetical protein
VDWPLYSPNLNQIQHIWRHCKELINKHHSKLETLISEHTIIKKCMTKALQEDWTVLKYKLFKKLVVSIEKQIKTFLKTDDWHTNIRAILQQFSSLFLTLTWVSVYNSYYTKLQLKETWIGWVMLGWSLSKISVGYKNPLQTQTFDVVLYTSFSDRWLVGNAIGVIPAGNYGWSEVNPSTGTALS